MHADDGRASRCRGQKGDGETKRAREQFPRIEFWQQHRQQIASIGPNRAVENLRKTVKPFENWTSRAINVYNSLTIDARRSGFPLGNEKSGSQNSGVPPYTFSSTSKNITSDFMQLYSIPWILEKAYTLSTVSVIDFYYYPGIFNGDEFTGKCVQT